MPLISVILQPGSTGPSVAELQNELAALNMVIDPAEQTLFYPCYILNRFFTHAKD
jgi:hypothetical protein